MSSPLELCKSMVHLIEGCVLFTFLMHPGLRLNPNRKRDVDIQAQGEDPEHFSLHRQRIAEVTLEHSIPQTPHRILINEWTCLAQGLLA